MTLSFLRQKDCKPEDVQILESDIYVCETPPKIVEVASDVEVASTSEATSETKCEEKKISDDFRNCIGIALMHEIPEECVLKLLSEIPSEHVSMVLSPVDDKSISPLIIAMTKYSEDVIFKMLEMGADITKDYCGISVLMNAIRYQSVGVVKKLISMGADVNYVSPKGFTAVEFAITYATNEVKELIIDQTDETVFGQVGGTQSTVLLKALRFCSYEIIEKIVNKVPGLINTPDCRGTTPLSMAIEYQPIEVVEFILEKGGITDINKPSQNGRTPLMCALISGTYPVVMRLLSLGADKDVNVKDAWGTSPLLVAKDKQITDVVHRLKSLGAR